MNLDDLLDDATVVTPDVDVDRAFGLVIAGHRRRRARRRATVIVAAAVLLVGAAAGVLVSRDVDRPTDVATNETSGDHSDRDRATGSTGTTGSTTASSGLPPFDPEDPTRGLDQVTILAQHRQDDQAFDLVVLTGSSDTQQVSRFCIGTSPGGAGGCDLGPDLSTFGVVLVDGNWPFPYAAFQVPPGIAVVEVTWEDGATEQAQVARPVAEEATGFAAVVMPRQYAGFSFVGLGSTGEPVTSVQQRPPALGGQ